MAEEDSNPNTRPRWSESGVGNRIVDSRTASVNVPPARAFAPIRRIGGTNGWYWGSWLWQLRGFVDLLAGGVGMRRGRFHPEDLRVGDFIDCWRVEAFEPDRRLRLVAEMRLPGRAWLEFEVTGDHVSSTIRQTAIFDPRGWAGLAYWYLLYPVHWVIFAKMLSSIVEACSRQASRKRKTN